MYNATSFTPYKWRKKKFIINSVSFKDFRIKDCNIEKTKGVLNKSSEKKLTSNETKSQNLIENHSNKNSSNIFSGFSLKSIQLKKDIKNQNKKISSNVELENSFNIDDFMIYWTKYIKKIESNGNQNILAILRMDTPRLVEKNNIEFNVPNSINKVEMNKELETMLPFLKENLKNHKIKFIINIVENLSDGFVFTTKEKFEKMKLINPSIKILKKTFDLDI